MRSSKADDGEADDEGAGDGEGGGGTASEEETEEQKGSVAAEASADGEPGTAFSSEDAPLPLPPKKKRKYKIEKPPRSKDWDDKSIKVLIAEYGARFSKTSEEISERATEANRRTWKEITRKLRKSGYSFSVKSARKKWDSLEAVYVDMTSHNIHPGLKRMTCPYGRELTAILNPGGMKNYLQIEEEVQKEMEKAEKENDLLDEIIVEKIERPKGGVSCIVRNMMARPKVIEEASGSRNSYKHGNTPIQSLDSDSDVITLSDQSDDEAKIEPVNRPESSAGSSQSTPTEDVVLSVAFQMYRHFAHHQHVVRPETSRQANRPANQESQSSSAESPSPQGSQTNESPRSSSRASAMVHVSDSSGGLLAPLQKVIERLMVERERKMALLEERNEIDRQRLALDQTRVRLMDQLITIVSSRRNT